MEQKEKKKKSLFIKVAWIIAAIALTGVLLYEIHRLIDKGIVFYEYEGYSDRLTKKLEEAKPEQRGKALEELYHKKNELDALERLSALKKEEEELKRGIKEFEASGYKEDTWPYLHSSKVSPYEELKIVQDEIKALKEKLQINKN